jgi:hypothetical protein
LSNEQSIFYAHPCYKGHNWYDWAIVNFEEKNNSGELFDSLYPSRLIGFISINGEHEAVVQCSLKPLSWDDVEKNFIQEIQLGTNFDVSFVTVPIESMFICYVPFLILVVHYRNMLWFCLGEIGVASLAIK